MDDRIQKVVNQYNKIASSYGKNIQNYYTQEDIDYFAKLLKPQSKVIDIGCAAGRDSRILKDLGFDVIGIDLSEKLLEIAKKNNPDITFIQADFRKIPFPDNTFDGLWASAVFHHLDYKDMVPALWEFKRVLVKNRILYIRTKEGKGNWKKKEYLAVNEEREFNLLTKEQLEAMVKETGFEILKIETVKDKLRDLLWIVLFCRK